MSKIDDLLARITPLQPTALAEARQRQQELTKPTGSLGRLEEIAVRMAGITGQVTPRLQRKAVVVMAADHGVAREGVSAYPVEVTAQMVLNFLHGGAAINALARQAEASVTVVDIGVATEIAHPQLLARKVRYGTANMLVGPAMSEAEMLQAIHVGAEVITALADKGLDIVAIGEMGIGNTTAASAITACILDLPVAEVTGRGTGLNDQQLAQKIQIIERAIAHNQPRRADPLDILAKVGGLEIAGLTGVILGAAARHIPVVMDGFISSTAALVAYTLKPALGDYLFAGHVSVERGHQLLLARMGLYPLLDLQMRLGEGSGAVLALHIIDGALRTHAEMATFAEAGVSDKEQ
jgi:nicotinate-nucleotide--dimethylbenzimidazole phosphoribosyltransferase